MLTSITILKLPEFVRSKLQKLGFEYMEDIEEALNNYNSWSTQFHKIAIEHNIISKIRVKSGFSEVISATKLRHREFCNVPVSVFHKGLNKLLDGGLLVGRVTELCGKPGCGKTQMCIQFCIDVQMPFSFGGSSGEALYISTDCGFNIERLQEMISASIKHFSGINFPNKDKILKNLSVESLLKGINVCCPCDMSSFLQVVITLDSFLERNKKIKLLIIDSFSFVFVTYVEDLLYRSKIMSEVLDVLQNLAMKYTIAVVLTNQLMTVIAPNEKAFLKPSLGEGFGHKLHQRLLLDKGKVYLNKSINHSQVFTFFEINKDGIR